MYKNTSSSNNITSFPLMSNINLRLLYPDAMAIEVPRKDYKVTSPVTVDGMKQNRLTAIGSGDKTRRNSS